MKNICLEIIKVDVDIGDTMRSSLSPPSCTTQPKLKTVPHKHGATYILVARGIIIAHLSCGGALDLYHVIVKNIVISRLSYAWVLDHCILEISVNAHLSYDRVVLDHCRSILEKIVNAHLRFERVVLDHCCVICRFKNPLIR